VAQKLEAITELSINHIKSYYSLPMTLDFFVNLRCPRSRPTTTLLLGIKYSMRDLIYGADYCSWAVFVRHRSHIMQMM